MKHIKKQIYDILREHQVDEQSSTGITGEKIIYGDYYEFIVQDIANLIQIIFDPENQPNQLGIENPFKQRSYSEEEVKKLMFDFYYDMSHKMNVPENLISENMTNVDVWFETFKNKK